MPNVDQLNKVRIAAIAAVQAQNQTQVPAELTLAQYILESGWGSHSPANNCFGIKVYPGSTGRQLLHTIEWFTIEQVKKWTQAVEGRVALPEMGEAPDSKGRTKYKCQDWFATFPTELDCFIKHSDIFTSGSCANYLGTYKINKDLISFIANVARVYATDPNYHTMIMKLISMPEVEAALKAARNEVHQL